MGRTNTSLCRLASCLLLSFLLASTAHAQAPSQVDAAATTPTLFDNPPLVQRYIEEINADEMAAHLHFFASDFFEGREATSDGQRMAAYYLAAQHMRLGLPAKGTIDTEDRYDPRAYFQPFNLEEERLKSADLILARGVDTLVHSGFSPTRYDGQAFPRYGGDTDRTGGVVFAGYGIADDGLGYNDYAALAEAGISPEGKWLIIFRDEPMADEETSLFDTPGGGPSDWTSQWWQKLVTAYQYAQPAGILVIGDVGPRGLPVDEQAELESLRRDGVGSLSLPGTGGGSRSALPPLFVISTDVADRIMAPAGYSVEDVHRRINSTLEPIVFEAEGVRARGRIETERRLVETENVLAFIEGNDPLLKDEVVVVLAHYDHEGKEYGPQGEKIVYNGADDNGSGTIGVLQTAKAFAAAARDGYGPRRSVLFLHVTAEEKGLLGSAYYTDEEPVFPLENTVAALNMDMIGRYDPTHPTSSEEYVYIIGSYLISQDLHDINVRANEVTGINLELDERFNDPQDPNQFYRRSDQWNFGKHGVPFIFFFTGTHEDYHQPGDEPHKIDYDRMERIVRLVFATTWQLANQDERPEVTGRGFN